MIRKKLKKSFMQENNFEKRVQQRMDELKVQPSAEVWDKVYARIKKEKRRRRFIIWLLLGGALVAGGGVLWFSGKKDKTVITDHTIVRTTAADEEIKKDKTIIPDEINNQENKVAGKQNQPESERGPEIKKEVIADKEQISLKQFRLPEKFKKDYTQDKGNQVLKNNKTEPAPVNLSQNLKTDQQNNLRKADAGRTLPADFKKPATTDSNKADKLTTQPTPTVDSLQQKLMQKIPADKTDSVMRKAEDPKPKKEADSLKQKIEKPKDPAVAAKPPVKKWTWGVHFSPGISSINEQLISISSNKSADFVSNPNPTGSGAVTPVAGPSKRKPGFAFQVGVFVQRNLSRRTKFETGLQFGYYSDRIGVGNRRDSVLNNSSQFDFLRDATVVYNPGGDSIHYTNRYHFLELPVGAKFQMNKKAAKPLYLNMGFNIGWMAGTNALVYDTVFGGIYYNSKNHFNRLQFSFSLGLDWTLFKNDKIEWHIGPVINLHLNQMLNNPLDRNKYLFFAGVRTSILFNKKK
jgi:hypothetical protein